MKQWPPLVWMFGLIAALVGFTATPAAYAAPEGPDCAVTGGTLTWGVKEGFRAYISGTIANGEWETADGAIYETPYFSWVHPTGALAASSDASAWQGKIEFPGTIHFSGHEGVLDLTLENPTVEFDGSGTAALLLDARSTDMEGQITVDEQQVWFADLDLTGATATAVEGGWALTAVPATLTNAGDGAFAGFYEAGAQLDPVDLVVLTPDCAATAEIGAAPGQEPTTPTDAEVPSEASQTTSSVPWVPVIIGGVALLVIGVTAGILIRPRPRPDSQNEDPTSE